MKVLVACEYSGTVRDAFIRKGHDAISCDLLPTEAPGPHYQGDVSDIINNGFDLMIAHPPCTYLSKAGLHYLRKDPARKSYLIDAFNFVKELWKAPIEKICIENPPGWLSKNWQRPTQIIQPYYYGDQQLKETCLWLKNLSRLNGNIEVAKNKAAYYPTPRWEAKHNRPGKNYKRKYYFVSTVKGGHKKAKTFPGITNAMAEQWG